MISTHVPRVGYDLIQSQNPLNALKFQLTYPVWGTTPLIHECPTSLSFQLTYPVWGTTCWGGIGGIPMKISTHVPRVGYDLVNELIAWMREISTHVPRVGYDNADLYPDGANGISTHVPRVGYDKTDLITITDKNDFNSRTPCGVRPGAKINPGVMPISTHVPRVGYDMA